MATTLDKQVIQETCEHCGAEFAIVRGSVFEDDLPCGLYLIGLHCCDAQLGGHAAIAILSAEGPVAAALFVTASAEQFEVSIVDWDESPWAGEDYLGTMLDRDGVLANAHRDDFFHILEHITSDLSEVVEYFDA